MQDDVYDKFLEMLLGAMDELNIGDPWSFATDIGPLISPTALNNIQTYIDTAASEQRLVKQIKKNVPNAGHFFGPAVIPVNGLEDIAHEVFGPVLHITKFHANELKHVINEINDSRYGLTFGVHTRIDSRVESLVNSLNVGNIYVNRDQIGAVVGSQPFGGENLSGTGPKAGVPHYLKQFLAGERRCIPASQTESVLQIKEVQLALDSLNNERALLNHSEMSGPTGKSNKLYEYARGSVICLGPDLKSADEQATIAQANGCATLIICPGANTKNSIDAFLPREYLTTLQGFSVVTLWSDDNDASLARHALAQREGQIISFACGDNLAQACRLERHVCVDTTAAGGNAALLADAP